MKRRAVVLTGPPTEDPNGCASAVAVVEQCAADPHAAYLHVTGTAVCCNRERLPRNLRRRVERIETVEAGLHRPMGGPVEVPWPSSAFKLAWPHSEPVMRLLFAAARNRLARKKLVGSAQKLYFSASTTTPRQMDVVATLLGGVAQLLAGGGFRVASLDRESPGLNFIVRTALQHGTVLSLPKEVVITGGDSFYAAFVHFQMWSAVGRIEARYMGTGKPWPDDAAHPPAQGGMAMELATQIGLLKLSSDRRRHMETMLLPQSNFRPLPAAMRGCFSDDRRLGVNCVACPLADDQKAVVCDAGNGDGPSDVWARHAACDGGITVDSLVGTVPPCIAPFGTMVHFGYRRRQDVANTVKLVTQGRSE